MADKTVVNYDELQRVTKQFNTDAESWAEMTSRTLQMVHELESEWIGEGADKFFEEFHNVLLPALNRLHYALLFSSDTLQDVMKIFDQAENESADKFKEGSLNDEDFGAGAFGGILGGLPGGRTDPGDLRDLDFGLDDVEVGGSGGSGSGDLPGGGSSSDGGTDAGAGSGQGGSSGGSSGDPAAETASTGGGGGSGSSNQGLRGDLSNMGTGSSSQQSVGGGSTGGGSQDAMPDHVYQSSSSGGGASSTPPSQSQPASPSGSESEGQGVGGMVGTAGAIGGAGAAAGAAKKALQGDDDEE